MNILFCNYEYPPLGGGGGVINAQVAEELAKRHNVTVLTSQGFDLQAHEVVNNVEVIRVPVLLRNQKAAASFMSMFSYLPMGAKHGANLLRKEKFDVINTHFVLPTGPVGDYLAGKFDLPNVLSVHGGDLYDPSKFSSPHRHFILRQWVKRLLRKADYIVGQSENTLDNVRKYYDDSLPLEKIPLGINRPPREAGTRSDYGIKGDDIVLVTVGRLVARKAVDQLLEIVSDVHRQDVHLIVVGSGPQEQTLREKASELQIDKQVHFLANVDDAEKFRVLNMSDIFVSTAQHEGFGLVFLEGMATEMPVICYDNGGQTDFLTHDETGGVIPLNNKQKFTEYLQSLVDDKEKRLAIAKANLEFVENYYIDRCAERYETLFEQAIEKAK